VAVWPHAKLYSSLLLRTIKIIILTVWPVSLIEAKNNNFKNTQKSWNLIYAGLALMGVATVFLVEPLISFLTHGKLVGASVLVPWWVVYCLIQNTGKEAEAVLYTFNLGHLAVNAQTYSKMIGFVAFIVLTWSFGLSGALGAALLEVICYRFFIRRAVILI
jgi:hypothetical protein